MAGLTAMFAACTNEDVLENFGTNEVAKTEGITFSIAGGVESRGDFKQNEAGNFVPGWNAELDRINIVHYGVATGLAATETSIETWGQVAGAERKTGSGNLTPVTYKATKSGSKGVFTAANDADLLHFTKVNATTPRIASFRAFRGVEDTDVTYSTDDNVETMTIAAPVLETQTQASASKAPFDNFVMVSDTIGNICALDYAVGESIDLSFEMPYTGLVIKTTGYDKNVYGNLTSVNVELEDNNIANDAIALDIAKKKDGKWAYNATGTASQEVTLTVNAEWSDNYHAFMQVLPVKRTETEKYWVTLTFANGTIKVQKTSSKNWEANGFYTINVDLTATANYLHSGNTLTVIKALPELNASNMFDGTVAASSITKLVSGKVLTADELAVIKAKYTGVQEFVLANEGADLGANLSNLKASGVTSLTLTAAKTAPVITSYSGLINIDCPEVTTIPDGAFKGNTESFAKLNFPKVQTIGKEAFSGTTAITEISCAAAGTGKLTIGTTATTAPYAKTSALTTVGEKAFAGLTNLAIVDAPALTTMGNYVFGTNTSGCAITNLLLPAYDWAASTDLMTSLYLLANNNVLVEVDFSGTTTIAGTTVPKAGNTLTSVILAANTNVGAGAFASQTNANFAVVNINKVASVADNAFNGSTLEGDIKFENTVAAIGAGAFAGTQISSFDFTGVTAIGEGAFAGITTLSMINVPSVEVLEASVFEGCSGVTAAQFDAATTLKDDALNGLETTANVVFKKAITTFEGNPFGATFPAVTDDNKDIETPCAASAALSYNLYVNAAQEGVSTNAGKWYLTYKSGDYYYKVEFAKIVK